MSPRASVVLPCLNEEATVGDCVRRARAAFESAGIECEVVVCDNGSTDASPRLAAEAGARVVTESRKGYGSAFMAGIEAARGDVLVLADADGTYPLERAPEFVRLVDEHGGIVIGSRFRGEIKPGSMPALHRLVGSPATRLLLRLLFGVRGSDPHCGMRAMTAQTYRSVRPDSRGMEFAIEMIVNAARRSVPLHEVPIVYAAREGESKLRALPDGWALLRFLLVHSPTALQLVPGAVAMVAGGALLLWLTAANRTLGSITLGPNSMVVAALAVVAGHQLVTLGLAARAAGHTSRRDRGSVSKRVFSLERGLVVGLVALVVGLVLVGSVGARWLATDFGALARSDHGVAILGLVATVLGLQTVLSSFFLALFLDDE